MTIHHVALFRFNDGVGDDVITEITAQLATMPTTVSTIRNYHFGPDLSLADGNFDYGVVAEFNTVSDWETYRDHPAHLELINTLIKPNTSARAATQFQT